jgi:hypothetical protein
MIIWGRRGDLQHVQHECLKAQVLPGGRGYLALSITQIRGALLVQQVLPPDSRRGVVDGAGADPPYEVEPQVGGCRARPTSGLPGHHQQVVRVDRHGPVGGPVELVGRLIELRQQRVVALRRGHGERPYPRHNANSACCLPLPVTEPRSVPRGGDEIISTAALGVCCGLGGGDEWRRWWWSTGSASSSRAAACCARSGSGQSA